MNITFFLMLGAMIVFLLFSQRTQKKQYQKRMDSLSRLEKGTDVITIGGLYGTIDEVDKEKGTIVLDVDGVYLTFELSAVKKVLPPENIASETTEVIEEVQEESEVVIEEETNKEE